MVLLKNCTLFLLAGMFAIQPLIGQPLEGGMWMPDQLAQLDSDALEKMGLKLSSDALYHPEKASLKDAIVSFGGFCTAAFVSDEGLLLTNHHCAYGAIEARSMRGRNILRDGFWATKHANELRNPGLVVTLLVRTADVSEAVMDGLPSGLPESKRQAWLDRRTAQVAATFAAETGLEARIQAGIAGIQWFLHLSRTFTDVRLVGTPPASIARFGGDAAGRDWPMHTADFALFRVYADKDNEPADYAAGNRPFRPAHHFPVARSGVREGDFTLVPGYPGHTDQYLSSFAVRERLTGYNPNMVRLRTAALEVLVPDMENSQRLRAKYETMYSSLHNTQASLQGEMAGLRKLDAVGRKIEEEVRMRAWISETNARKAAYGNLLADLRLCYLRREMHLAKGLHLRAALSWIGLMDFANEWRTLGELTPTASTRTWNTARSMLYKQLRPHFRNYSAATDEKMCARMLELLYAQLPASHHEMVFPGLEKRYSGDFAAYARRVFARSILVSGEKTGDFLRGMEPQDLRKLKKDPGYALMARLVTYFNSYYYQEWRAGEENLAALQREYERVSLEMQAGKLLSPDADGTLRFSFGQVAGYAGEDGVRYRYCTTTKGVLEKFRARSEDFDLPEGFVARLRAGGFGGDGLDGHLPVNFMATNHTANGNSGSPVLDGEGRLVGLNSARTLESAMSDVIYDRETVRNVAVDIRYILFVMRHFAGSQRLLAEMEFAD